MCPSAARRTLLNEAVPYPRKEAYEVRFIDIRQQNVKCEMSNSEALLGFTIAFVGVPLAWRRESV